MSEAGRLVRSLSGGRLAEEASFAMRAERRVGAGGAGGGGGGGGGETTIKCIEARSTERCVRHYYCVCPVPCAWGGVSVAFPSNPCVFTVSCRRDAYVFVGLQT